MRLITKVVPIGLTCIFVLVIMSAQSKLILPEVRQIGQSTKQHPIEAYRFGNGWRRVIFVGGIHGGYERNTVELAWQLIDHFTANPTIVPRSLSLEIIPVANPDGLERVIGTPNGSANRQQPVLIDPYVGRFNANNVDLNRNWDCNWSSAAQGPRGATSGGAAAMSEVETQALAGYLSAANVAAVIFWHSSANGVYAGGCNGEFAAASTLAHVYSEGSGYPFFPAFTAYPITGDATDWLALQGIPAIVVELRTQSSSEFDQNLQGVLATLGYYAATATSTDHCKSTPKSIVVSRFYAQPALCKTWLQP